MIAKCIKTYKNWVTNEILFEVGKNYEFEKKDSTGRSFGGMYVSPDSLRGTGVDSIQFNYSDYMFFFITMDEHREIALKSLLKDEI
jgi:hypothetical protein